MPNKPNQEFVNQVFYKSSVNMEEIPDATVNLIVTSPPYFNIKDYSKDGYQQENHSIQSTNDVGNTLSYQNYLDDLLKVWEECQRVLKPNGKLCINVPLMPMLKRKYTTHYNRHIFDIQSGIQQTIVRNTELFLLDVYIWNRSNPSKGLMFGSYPYPSNFYAQNTVEFISVYVKDGLPINNRPPHIKERSKLTKEEWTGFTKQIWDIPIPNRSDAAYGIHPAIMPEEIAYRCIRLYSYVEDLVLDPFAGSGTTLKVAKENSRNYVGYELYDSYKSMIEYKLSLGQDQEFKFNESSA